MSGFEERARTFARLRQWLGSELVAERVFPASPAAMAEQPVDLDSRIAEALRREGQFPLFRHQAAALEALRRGENVLLTTPTASGKSLVFALPVLEAAVRREAGKSLWLFPLKALARDQLRKLETLARACGLGPDEFEVAVYDGDTSRSERTRLRQRPPRVLLTNPEMLHLALLARPEAWAPFLRELRWIVLDELHVYRGLFGAHVHHLLARLRRLAARHGRLPNVIAASATAHEADRFARALCGTAFRWIESSGAPRPRRSFWFVRPRGSPYATAVRLLEELLASGWKTIVFSRARRTTELLWKRFERGAPELASRVRIYRSGFLPEERRRIEQALASGAIEGVIATSALELGVDIGGLDACVLVGWPGSVMATWQRSGRVGRAGRDALTVLVALPDALDQYLLNHPDEFFERPCERLAVDPSNPHVAKAHLLAAAAETPLDRDSDRDYLEPHVEVLNELVSEGALLLEAGRPRLHARDRYPHRSISLRTGGREVRILESASGRLVGTLDAVRARSEGYPGAIYLHGGKTYRVEGLDLQGGVVRVETTVADHYTQPILVKQTELLQSILEVPCGAFTLGFGRFRVTEQLVGFEVRKLFSAEILDRVELLLPPICYETQGVWFGVETSKLVELLGGDQRHPLGTLHAAEHASIGLLPLVTVCDRSEIGGISFLTHHDLRQPGWIVYEGAEGGAGILARAFEALPQWVGKAAVHVAECPCEDGCPSCIHSPKCGNGNRPLDKAGAGRLLEVLSEQLCRSPWRVRLAARQSSRTLEDLFRGRERWPWRLEGQERARPDSGCSTPIRRVPGAAVRTVLFDVETLRAASEVGGWKGARRMGMALAVALELETNTFHVFREPQARELVDLLESAALVVGYNVLRFDYAVLSAYSGGVLLEDLTTLDLLAELQRSSGVRASLDRVARATLGRGKSGNGLQSLEWVRQGRLDLVEEYCRRDVELLRDLYLFGRQTGYVLVPAKAGAVLQVPASW